MSWGRGRFVAYAVTPALREWYLSDDIEELEYAALNRAALASLRLLAVDPERRAAPGRGRRGRAGRGRGRRSRPGARPRGARRGAGRRGRARWRRPRPCTWTPDDAEADVAAAAGGAAARPTGDDDAQFTVDGAEDHELLWFATQEIPNLVGLGD